MNQNMTAAQAAQQANRDNGGKDATKKVDEAEGVDAAAGQHQCPGCDRRRQIAHSRTSRS